MKKKLLMMLTFIMLGSIYSQAQTPVHLQIGIEDNSTVMPGNGKGPVHTPLLIQDGHNLQFESVHPPFTLTLLDSNGAAVFCTSVSSSATTLTLPTTLSYTYELRLQVSGSNYYFYGYISL